MKNIILAFALFIFAQMSYAQKVSVENLGPLSVLKVTRDGIDFNKCNGDLVYDNEKMELANGVAYYSEVECEIEVEPAKQISKLGNFGKAFENSVKNKLKGSSCKMHEFDMGLDKLKISFESNKERKMMVTLEDGTQKEKKIDGLTKVEMGGCISSLMKTLDEKTGGKVISHYLTELK